MPATNFSTGDLPSPWSILLFVGPWLAPKIFTYIQARRAPSTSPVVSSLPPKKISPLSRASARSLNILFVSSALFLLASLPRFSARNIFLLTESRIQIPTDALFVRLAALGPLTRDDLVLQTKFVSFESRLLYMMWGPSTIANCLFCNSDDFYSYFYYALPSLLLPHLFNFIALGLATSPTLTSPNSARFRFLAIMAATTIASIDLSATATYNHKLNTAAFRLSDIDFFAWRRRIFLLLSLCIFDLAFAGFLYLTDTNRFWVKRVTPAERLEASAKALETAYGKLHTVGIAKNVIMRDEGLRSKTVAYWEGEGKAMREIFEEREVVSGIQNALGRFDVQEIAREATKFADGLVLNVKAMGEQVPAVDEIKKA